MRCQCQRSVATMKVEMPMLLLLMFEADDATVEQRFGEIYCRILVIICIDDC